MVAAGDEVAAAERWVLANPQASQPWDRAGWRPTDTEHAAAMTARKRADALLETQGHYPAPLAILDCVGKGYAKPFDEAIRTEMRIFSKLIQRREPRNMIRTLLLVRLDHDRLKKTGGIPPEIESAVAAVDRVLHDDGSNATLTNALARAGFTTRPIAFDGEVAQSTYWLESEPATEGKAALREQLARASVAADHGGNGSRKTSAARPIIC